MLSRMRSLLRVIVYCSRRKQDVVAREYNVYVYIYITLIYIYMLSKLYIQLRGHRQDVVTHFYRYMCITIHKL